MIRSAMGSTYPAALERKREVEEPPARRADLDPARALADEPRALAGEGGDPVRLVGEGEAEAPGRAAALDRRERPFGGPLGDLAEEPPADRRRQVLAPVAPVVDALAGLVRRVEIGRASCRERV